MGKFKLIKNKKHHEQVEKLAKAWAPYLNDHIGIIDYYKLMDDLTAMFNAVSTKQSLDVNGKLITKK